MQKSIFWQKKQMNDRGRKNGHGRKGSEHTGGEIGDLGGEKFECAKNFEKIKTLMIRQKVSDESGIRTHASEETGALNQRLRPLGHLATCYIE